MEVSVHFQRQRDEWGPRALELKDLGSHPFLTIGSRSHSIPSLSRSAPKQEVVLLPGLQTAGPGLRHRAHSHDAIPSHRPEREAGPLPRPAAPARGRPCSLTKGHPSLAWASPGVIRHPHLHGQLQPLSVSFLPPT